MNTEQAVKKQRFWMPAPAVTPLRWLIILLVEAVSVGVLLLVGNRLISVPVFTFVPLAALIIFAKDMLKSSIHVPKFSHIMLGIGLGIAALLITMGVAFLIQSVIATTGNPMSVTLSSQGLAQNLFTLFLNLIQLFGEELMTFVVFMPVLQFFHHYIKKGKAPLIIAWVVSSIVFALVHLQTYAYNVIQVLLIIGVARMILSLGFILTDNLIVSYISHIVDDNIIFIYTMIVAAIV